MVSTDGLSPGSFTLSDAVGSVPVLSRDLSCAIPIKDNRDRLCCEILHADGRVEQFDGSPRHHCGSFPRAFSLSRLCPLPVGRLREFLQSTIKLHPFASTVELLTQRHPPKLAAVTSAALSDVVAVLSSRRLPAFTGRDLLTTTGSSDS